MLKHTEKKTKAYYWCYIYRLKIDFLTKNIKDGTGVRQFTLIKDIAAGKWPLRAPTKNRRDEAKIAPFNEPKVEQATKNGISQAMYPNILSPKVTATALEDNNSSDVNTEKYAIFATT